MLKDQLKKWQLYFRLIGIILFIILLFRIDLNEIWINLKKVNLSYMILAILFQIVMLIIKGLRWHLLNNGLFVGKSLLFNFGTFFESYAIGTITPGRLGELSKSGYEKTNRSKWHAALKIVAERGFDLGIFFLIASFSIIYSHILPIKNWLGVLILAIAIGLNLMSIVLITKNRLKTFIQEKIIVRMVKNYQPNELNFNLSRNRLYQIIILGVFSNAATFISCYLLALGINLNSSFWFTSGAVAVAGAINLLPITVMGIGTREVSFLYIFSQFNPSLVLAFSFLMLVVVQIGGGLISMVLGQVLIFRWKKKYN